MSPQVLVLVLAAALLHATWNAALRSGADRLWSITVMCAAAASLALPFAVFLPAPDAASFKCLALSTSLQVAYCWFLVRAYRGGSLAQVYPIARGSSPLLVTLGAAALAGEHLGPLALAGIALASAGIIGCAAGGKLDRSSLLAALATGCFIAGYTVTDGIGARASGHAVSYAAWLFVAHGAAMVVVYRATRGPLRVTRSPGQGRASECARHGGVQAKETLKAVGGGVLSVGSYGAVIVALSLSPMGATSALRETSVLFAALLGRVFLQERIGAARFVACAAVAAGAILLGVAR